MDSGVKAVESPCIGVCVLDEQNICEGCSRSEMEIARWRVMDEAEKRQVLTLSWERARAAGKVL